MALECDVVSMAGLRPYFCLFVLLLTISYSKTESSLPDLEPPPKIDLPVTTTLGNIVQNVTTQAPKAADNGTTLLFTPAAPPATPPPALGHACNSTADCKANHSSCVDKICSCVQDYIGSKEMLRCLPIVHKLGEGCSEDVQCSKGLAGQVGQTTCLNFICSCAIGMSLIDGKCQGPRVLNTNCTTDDDCPIKRSHCTQDRFCACWDGFVPNSDNNMCLSVNLQLQKMEGCFEDIQCQNKMGNMAVCVVGTGPGSCGCKPGSHQVLEKCVAYKALEEECSYDEECLSMDFNAESNSSRFCNRNKCACNTGFRRVNDICTSGVAKNSLAGALLSSMIIYWILQIRFSF